MTGAWDLRWLALLCLRKPDTLCNRIDRVVCSQPGRLGGGWDDSLYLSCGLWEKKAVGNGSPGNDNLALEGSDTSLQEHWLVGR